MSGRFFSLPFIFSLTIILTNVSLSNEKHKYGIVLTLIAFILLIPRSSVMSGADYTGAGSMYVEERGIQDERGYYYKNASLWRAIKGEEMPNPNSPSIKLAKKIKEQTHPIYLVGVIGFLGYYLGPETYILDPLCLPDPFRSRLNMAKVKNWRVGHYLRPIPYGYTLSILQQQNLINDPNLNKYYAVIRNIVRDDIFSEERFINIFKINFGFYNYLIENYKDQPYDEEIYLNDLVRFHPRYYENRGNYYQREKKYYEAIEDYRKYIEKVGIYDGGIWFRLAECLFKIEDYDKASLCWKNAKTLKADLDSILVKDFEGALNSALQKQNN
jgi:arabinofuranosyltransferase